MSTLPVTTEPPAALPLEATSNGHDSSFRRVKQILAELWGPSPTAQLEALSNIRNGQPAPGVKQRDNERNWKQLRNRVKELEEENERLQNAGDYQKGFEEGRNFQKFSYAAQALRSQRSDFDLVMKRFRQLPHSGIIQILAEREADGAQAVYAMAKREGLLKELRGLDAAGTRTRFIHFLSDWREEGR